jgi:hypothetical protein
MLLLTPLFPARAEIQLLFRLRNQGCGGLETRHSAEEG